VIAALILGVALALANADAPATANAGHDDGKQLYLQACASCHGVDLRGGTQAPTLIGVGAAGADFWVTTGRMPAAVPWVEVGHRGPQPYLTPAEQTSIVRYVAAASSGPPIPLVVTDGDADHGRRLFQENCMHCHGVDASGASIGRSTWAPSLDRATVTQVAEAIRIGPGQMPQFGSKQLDQSDLDDIATYLTQRRGAGRFVGLPLGTGGAVPEGLYGWLAAGALSLFAFGFWALDRTE